MHSTNTTKVGASVPENFELTLVSRPCKTSATRMNIGFAPVPLCA